MVALEDTDPRSATRDARRRAILAIARDIFLKEGYAEASMATVAARVGGSKGTLYNYFPSKQELFAAVVQDECDQKHAVMFGALSMEGDDVCAVLKRVGRRYAELVFSDDVVQMSRVVIAECVRFPEIGRILFEAGPRRSRLRLAEYLEQQTEAGRVRAADPMQVAAQFFEMCLSGLHRQRLMNIIPEPDEATRCAQVDSAAEVIMAAYGAA